MTDTNENRIYVGTVGEGLWISSNRGDTFERYSNEMYIEADVRGLAIHPQNSDVLYAGTNCGIYRSEDGGLSWTLLPTDFGTGWPGTSTKTVWCLTIDPSNSNTIYAGVCPGGIYRSKDAGETWTLLNTGISETCGYLKYTRVTTIAVDPGNSNNVFAGVEIDAVHRSSDGGETWRRLDAGLSSPDIHSLSINPIDTAHLLAATNNDLNVSTNSGETWTPLNVRAIFDYAYCRGILRSPVDSSLIIVGNGNGPPGTAGAIQVSRDGGESFKKAELDMEPNSTIWTFAADPAIRSQILGASVSGYLYLTVDFGSHWNKLDHEFGEIRSLAWG